MAKKYLGIRSTDVRKITEDFRSGCNSNVTIGPPTRASFLNTAPRKSEPKLPRRCSLCSLWWALCNDAPLSTLQAAHPEFVFGHEAPRELTCGWLASNPVQVTLSGDELGAGDLDGLLHRQGVPADMILGRTGLTNMHRGDCGRTDTAAAAKIGATGPRGPVSGAYTSPSTSYGSGAYHQNRPMSGR
jgi:hypothetical protein